MSLRGFFDCHRMSTLKQRLRLQIDWRPKKGVLFSLIYFFGSFCIILYYIPHNYVVPQAMPHAIPQTQSAFYPQGKTNTRKHYSNHFNWCNEEISFYQ